MYLILINGLIFVLMVNIPEEQSGKMFLQLRLIQNIRFRINFTRTVLSIRIIFRI